MHRPAEEVHRTQRYAGDHFIRFLLILLYSVCPGLESKNSLPVR